MGFSWHLSTSLVSGAPATRRGSLCTGYIVLKPVVPSNVAVSTNFLPAASQYASTASAGLLRTTLSVEGGAGSAAMLSSRPEPDDLVIEPPVGLLQTRADGQVTMSVMNVACRIVITARVQDRHVR